MARRKNQAPGYINIYGQCFRWLYKKRRETLPVDRDDHNYGQCFHWLYKKRRKTLPVGRSYREGDGAIRRYRRCQRHCLYQLLTIIPPSGHQLSVLRKGGEGRLLLGKLPSRSAPLITKNPGILSSKAFTMRIHTLPVNGANNLFFQFERIELDNVD